MEGHPTVEFISRSQMGTEPGSQRCLRQSSLHGRRDYKLGDNGSRSQGNASLEDDLREFCSTSWGGLSVARGAWMGNGDSRRIRGLLRPREYFWLPRIRK